MRVSASRAAETTHPLLVACVVSAFAGASVNADHGAFNYDPITEPILSATFSADFAALTAHRTVLGEELNMAMLLNLSTGPSDFDMSDDLFGTAAFPDPPLIDMGPLETGIVSAAVDPSFFPALESGHVGLRFLATDTNDALFAIDFLSLTIETTGRTVESLYGWPIGDENNGFGIGIGDGGNLPSPMPGVLLPTATGFDEEISGKSIIIPEPSTLGLFGLAVLIAGTRARYVRHQQRARRNWSGDLWSRHGNIAMAYTAIVLCVLCVRPVAGQVTHSNVNIARGCPGNGPLARGADCDGDGQGVPEQCFCPALFGGDCSGDPPPHCGNVCGFTGTNNCRRTAPICPPPPGVDDDRIDRMVDTAGNEVKLCCVDRRCNVPAGGVLYVLYFCPAGGGSRAIGACLFPWGQNAGWKEKNAGVFSEITWYNYEGRFPRGGSRSGPVHDSNNNGKEDRYCFIYDVATDRLRVKCEQRALRPNGHPNGGGPWTTVADTGFRRAPTTIEELQDLLNSALGLAFVSEEDQNNEIYASCIHLEGSIGGGGRVEITINDFTVGVTTSAGMSTADLVAALVTEFNDHWVFGKPAQQMQGLRADQSPVELETMSVSGAIEEQIVVALTGEPGLSFSFLCPDVALDQLHLVGPIPNILEVGQVGQIDASVAARFMAVPGVPVQFDRLEGALEFNVGEVVPDGSRTTVIADTVGVAIATFSSEAPGPALIHASIDGSSLSAYSFFEIVARPGDLNCDGAFNGGDIDPFFLALGDPAGYAAAFSNCEILLGDMNSDGVLNGADIDPFFACLAGVVCP